jgi:hypothetical protein
MSGRRPGLARVTASDVAALEALRQDAELARVTAGSADEQQERSPRLDHIREGELAAVMKDGSVTRLNPHHLAGVVSHLEKSGDPKLPSVVEVRAKFEIDRLEAAKFQQTMIDIQLQRGVDATAERLATIQARADAQEMRHVVRSVEDAATMPIAAAGEIAEQALGVGSKFGATLAAAVEGIGNFLSSIFPAPAPMTHDQAKRAERVADEKAQVAADVAAYRQNEADRQEQITRQDEQSQQPLTAPEYFRNLRQPGHDPGREKELDRDR